MRVNKHHLVALFLILALGSMLKVSSVLRYMKKKSHIDYSKTRVNNNDRKAPL